MKTLIWCITLLFLGQTSASAQDSYEGKLLAPDSLLQLIQTNDSNYVLMNTGPVKGIATAINIGAVEYEDKLQKLDSVSNEFAKAKTMIIYCGCCPLVVCPNIEPAVVLLESKGFQVRVLNLPEGIEEDWVDKGYPMKD